MISEIDLLNINLIETSTASSIIPIIRTSNNNLQSTLGDMEEDVHISNVEYQQIQHLTPHRFRLLAKQQQQQQQQLSSTTKLQNFLPPSLTSLITNTHTNLEQRTEIQQNANLIFYENQNYRTTTKTKITNNCCYYCDCNCYKNNLNNNNNNNNNNRIIRNQLKVKNRNKQNFHITEKHYKKHILSTTSSFNLSSSLVVLILLWSWQWWWFHCVKFFYSTTTIPTATLTYITNNRDDITNIRKVRKFKFMKVLLSLLLLVKKPQQQQQELQQQQQPKKPKQRQLKIIKNLYKKLLRYLVVCLSLTLFIEICMKSKFASATSTFKTTNDNIIDDKQLHLQLENDILINDIDMYDYSPTTTLSTGNQKRIHHHRQRAAANPIDDIMKPTQKSLTTCESKVLDDPVPDPLYDLTDITEEAAQQFAEYLSMKSLQSQTVSAPSSGQDSQQQQQSHHTPQQQSSSSSTTAQGTPDEIRKQANSIAKTALSQDENLLAFAIASPSLHVAVVKFRDNVTTPPQEAHNKAFLATYWRELGLAWNNTDGGQVWGSPFRDCNALQGRWLWPFRLSYIGYGYKIVAAAFIAADIDLCNDDLVEIFGRKHGCDRETTFCLMTEYQASKTRDVYTCLCKDSYYLPNSTLQGFKAEQVEGINRNSSSSSGNSSDNEFLQLSNFSCIPCPGGCISCDHTGTCLNLNEDDYDVSFETLFNVSICSVLGACMLCCIVLSVIVFRQRKCKAIATGMWTVLEHILIGILLLYMSVALHILPASTIRCLLEPWCRELGFMTCYGAIILKLYRHLVEFRTRKAHRWVLRDVDLLKYLFTMVFAVVCYMSAFTASSIDLIENASMLGLRETQTNTCVSLKWEYVTQVSEILILCFGLRLAFACRSATTQFRERQFLVAALIIEFLVSSTFYTLRVIYLPELSPGAIFLALFIRSQLTNTITLSLIFLPKLWYQNKQVQSLAHDLSLRLPVDAFKGSHDTAHHLGGAGGYAGLCLGDPDIGELTISEMSPEDIRAELKRLYTQLEIMKNKTLRQDNPHISKRRGGRKAGHRRFSLQKKGSKDKAISAKHRNKHHDIEITEAEPSRTPEDSVCSAEGPTDTYAEISGISHSMLSHSVISHSK